MTAREDAKQMGKNDEPTFDDKLERLDLVRRVGDKLATCDPPYAVGIHGDWGCGKTSFLCMLHLYLTGMCPQLGEKDDDCKTVKRIFGEEWRIRDNVTVVWFEAWRYQHEDAPIVALLQEMRTQLTWYTKWLRQGKKLAEVAIRGALLSLEDLTKRIGFQASKIERAGKDWERENLAMKLPSHAIREQLEAVFGKLLEGGLSVDGHTPRVIVLIDDLDRCQPEVAYKFLEGIKIYLNLKNCVFVLGMDENVVRDAIAKEVLGLDKPDSKSYLAREYLEKICQNIWHLPVVADQAGFLEGFLEDGPATEAVLRVIREYSCLPANPRKIKAFANVVQRYFEHLGWGQKTIIGERDAQRGVIMAYLYQFHHDIYRFLEGSPKFYGTIHNWASGETIDHEAFKDLKPVLKERSDEPAFADPVVGNVLRIQKLIRDVGLLTEDEVRSSLLDQPASSRLA